VFESLPEKVPLWRMSFPSDVSGFASSPVSSLYAAKPLRQRVQAVTVPSPIRKQFITGMGFRKFISALYCFWNGVEWGGTENIFKGRSSTRW
jgi:hypothetical protein